MRAILAGAAPDAAAGDARASAMLAPLARLASLVPLVARGALARAAPHGALCVAHALLPAPCFATASESRARSLRELRLLGDAAGDDARRSAARAAGGLPPTWLPVLAPLGRMRGAARAARARAALERAHALRARVPARGRRAGRRARGADARARDARASARRGLARAYQKSRLRYEFHAHVNRPYFLFSASRRAIHNRKLEIGRCAAGRRSLRVQKPDLDEICL